MSQVWRLQIIRRSQALYRAWDPWVTCLARYQSSLIILSRRLRCTQQSKAWAL